MLSQGWVESDSVELSGGVPRRSMWSSDGRGIQEEGHRTPLPRQKQERGFSLSLFCSFSLAFLRSSFLSVVCLRWHCQRLSLLFLSRYSLVVLKNQVDRVHEAGVEVVYKSDAKCW